MKYPFVTGLILAGGSSTRLGRDKATSRWRRLRFVDHVAAALFTVTDKVLVSVKDDTTDYNVVGATVVVDAEGGGGPLAGIYAGLMAMKTTWLLVLACDMPRILPASLNKIVAQTADAGSAVISVDSGGAHHPLCAAYHKSIIPTVELHLKHKIFAVKALFAALEEVHYVQVADEELTNVNTSEDLTALAQ